MYNLFDNDAWKQRGNASNVLTAEQIAQRGQAIDAQQAPPAAQAQTPPATQSQGTVAFTPGNQAIAPKETNPQRPVGYDIPTPVYKGGVTPNGGMDYLASLYTSPEQEERLRKASVNRQRILAVGDALRHIGNIYHTVNYAPSQQFNKPWEDEYTRYQTQKTVRDAANQKYLAYQQAKAAQDAKQKQWEATFAFNAAKDEREAARKERLADAQTSRWNAQSAKDEASKAYWDTRARLLEAGWPLDKAIKEAKKAEIDERTRLTKIKADQGGWAPKKSGGGGGRSGSGGGKYWAYDENGQIHYYPNKTMWEQAVNQFGNNLPQTYTTESTSGSGEKRTTSHNRSSASKGGELARNAANKKSQANKPKAQPKAQAKAPAKKSTTNGKKIKVNW